MMGIYCSNSKYDEYPAEPGQIVSTYLPNSFVFSDKGKCFSFNELSFVQ
jgi:hypothetical protein